MDSSNDVVPSYRRPLPLFTQVIRFIPVFLTSVMILAAALLVANARMPDPQEVRPLPDLLFDIFKKIGWFEKLTDVVIFLLNATAVIVLLKVFLLERRERGSRDVAITKEIPVVTTVFNDYVFHVIDSGVRPFPIHGACFIAIIRFLCVYTVVMVFRAAVISMTSYPATDNHCQHPQKIEHPLLNMVLTLVTLGSGAIHCGDLMFSGHTIILCLAFLLVWNYSPFIHPWAFRVWAGVLLPLSFYFIVASRSHYTDDVLVAAYVTVATYVAMPHKPSGAPWQLQLLIRWWPCPGSSEPMSGVEANDVVQEMTPAQANATEAVKVEIITEERDN